MGFSPRKLGKQVEDVVVGLFLGMFIREYMPRPNGQRRRTPTLFTDKQSTALLLRQLLITVCAGVRCHTHRSACSMLQNLQRGHLELAARSSTSRFVGLFIVV